MAFGAAQPCLALPDPSPKPASNSSSSAESLFNQPSPRPTDLFRGQHDDQAVRLFLWQVCERALALNKPKLSSLQFAVLSCIDFNMPGRDWVINKLKDLTIAAKKLSQPPPDQWDTRLEWRELEEVLTSFRRACIARYRHPKVTCSEVLGGLVMQPGNSVETHNHKWREELATWGEEQRPSDTELRRMYLQSLAPWLWACHPHYLPGGGTLEDLMSRVARVYVNYESLWMVPAASDPAWHNNDPAALPRASPHPSPHHTSTTSLQPMQLHPSLHDTGFASRHTDGPGTTEQQQTSVDAGLLAATLQGLVPAIKDMTRRLESLEVQVAALASGQRQGGGRQIRRGRQDHRMAHRDEPGVCVNHGWDDK